MSLAAGSKLDPYEILAPLGAGGMGEGVSSERYEAEAPSRAEKAEIP